MTLDSKNGRAPTPGRSTTPDQRSISPGPPDRLRAAMWTWRLRIPHGPAGHRYFFALERQLAAHLARNHAAMLRDGWPPDQAQAAALQWLHDLAEQASRDAFATTETGR
jgi:hypothetical protein